MAVRNICREPKQVYSDSVRKPKTGLKCQNNMFAENLGQVYSASLKCLQGTVNRSKVPV